MSERAAAPFERRRLRVLANEQLGAYRVLRAAAPADGPPPAAGQFAMIAAEQRWGGGEDERPHLPRAFSLLRVREGEWHFMLEDVGPGTRRLCELREGEGLLALGPLGNGFRYDAEAPALLVGGGVGTAPLAILQDQILARAGQGARASALLGFRDCEHARGAQLLSGASVATNDGSVGHHGLVTDLLAAELERAPESVVYACGPPAMLEAVRALCEQRRRQPGCSVRAQLALEAGMACGYGACFGCAVPLRGGGYARVCLDGPVLDASELAHVDSHDGAAQERSSAAAAAGASVASEAATGLAPPL